MQGGDRWQPPEVPNTGEVLIRPEPVDPVEPEEEDAVAVVEQHLAASLPPAEASLPATVPAAAVSTTAVVGNGVEQSQEVGPEKEQRQHRHRSAHMLQHLDTIPMSVQHLSHSAQLPSNLSGFDQGFDQAAFLFVIVMSLLVLILPTNKPTGHRSREMDAHSLQSHLACTLQSLLCQQQLCVACS